MRITAQQKRAVVERARGCCEYCRSQARFATQSFSVEHITPRSRSGETNLDNLALACEGCNSHKHAKIEAYDPITGEIVALYHPRQQRWYRHFRWNDDFTLIVGITPTGRATVEALQLNREGLINLRQVLYEAGEHPPVDIADSELQAHEPSGSGT
jgi:hypothetical protein